MDNAELIDRFAYILHSYYEKIIYRCRDLDDLRYFIEQIEVDIDKFKEVLND